MRGWRLPFLRCSRDLERLRSAARDLADAVRANELQVSSNDLGNAMDAVERELARGA